MRVLVTGVGGDLGRKVALLLAADPGVSDLVGTDMYPPRGRVRNMTFRLIDPRDRRPLLRLVREVEPTAIVHLGIYEPSARSTPHEAWERTESATLAVLGEAADLGALERVVLRSGLEVYGRGRGSVTVPDEAVPPVPTSAFGRSLLEVERLAFATGQDGGVPVAALRFAPLVGPRFPSPLGRLLRLPVVPFSALADPPFSVVHADDAAAAVVAALRAGIDGPLNVVAPGAVTVSQAALMGRRLPLGLLGPEWALVRRLTAAAGAPLPSHLMELLHRGRTACGARCRELVPAIAERTTADIVAELHGWSDPARLQLVQGEAA
ncbi:MAG TPA: NAD-dependent epimerase/dehydratase family protein [Acidimicrobiales bacterium]